MATEYNITQKQYNGTDYDTLYPQTTSQQVLLNDDAISHTGSATVNGALMKQQTEISSLNSKIDYGSSLAVNSFTAFNCTGTPSGTLYFKATNNGRWVYASGRVNIPNYTRTGGNPGISFTLPDGVPTPTSTGSTPVGINSIFPRETLILGTTAGSRTARITTTESYGNMTGSVLTYILTGVFFYIV